MLFSSALVSVAGLASLLTLGLANHTGLAPSGAEAPQWCCNCESCTNCDASCPDPGCGLFECCCATGRVLEARDGSRRYFNLAGVEMNFVSRADVLGDRE